MSTKAGKALRSRLLRARTITDVDAAALMNDVNTHRDAAVHHPSHYGGDTPYEVIKVCEAWLSREEFIGAMKFQIYKYTARAGKKATAEELQDFDKSLWYHNYLNDYLRRAKCSS